jgi:hypothetical protein
VVIDDDAEPLQEAPITKLVRLSSAATFEFSPLRQPSGSSGRKPSGASGQPSGSSGQPSGSSGRKPGGEAKE